MTTPYPLRPLGEALERIERVQSVDPAGTYPMLGVRSFGAGAFAAADLGGSETRYQRLLQVQTNDIVYPKLMAWEGAFAIVPPELTDRYVSPEFCSFVVRPSRADSAYVAYALRTPSIQESVAGGSTGTNVRRRRLYPLDFLEREIPLPDINEQRRVADRLAKAVNRIEAAAAAFRAHPPEEFLASIPSLIDGTFRRVGAGTALVGELADTVSDTVHPGEHPGEATCFVGLQHIESHTGRMTGWMPLGNEKGRKFRFQPGDIVYGYLRPYLNKVWVADRHGLCSVDQYVLRAREGVSAVALAYALRSRTALNQAIELTHNLQLPRLRSGLLLDMAIPWPSNPSLASEQLDRMAERACLLVDLRRRQLRTSHVLIPSLLNQAFTSPA